MRIDAILPASDAGAGVAARRRERRGARSGDARDHDHDARRGVVDAVGGCASACDEPPSSIRQGAFALFAARAFPARRSRRFASPVASVAVSLPSRVASHRRRAHPTPAHTRIASPKEPAERTCPRTSKRSRRSRTSAPTAAEGRTSRCARDATARTFARGSARRRTGRSTGSGASGTTSRITWRRRSRSSRDSCGSTGSRRS